MNGLGWESRYTNNITKKKVSNQFSDRKKSNVPVVMSINVLDMCIIVLLCKDILERPDEL